MPKKTTPPAAWSYSALSLYELCPLKYKFAKVLRMPEPKAPAMMRGIKIHDQAAKFLAGETDEFPTSCATFKEQFYELREFNPIVEQKWAFDPRWRSTGFFAKDVKCRVILDAGLVYDDNTADVIDHKTGKRYDDDYSDQTGLFAAATIKKYPYVQHVTTRLWYLDSGDEVIVEYSKDEALGILDDLEERAEVMINDRSWVANPNSKCKWCHWRASNGGPCVYG